MAKKRRDGNMASWRNKPAVRWWYVKPIMPRTGEMTLGLRAGRGAGIGQGGDEAQQQRRVRPSQ